MSRPSSAAAGDDLVDASSAHEGGAGDVGDGVALVVGVDDEAVSGLEGVAPGLLDGRCVDGGFVELVEDSGFEAIGLALCFRHRGDC